MQSKNEIRENSLTSFISKKIPIDINQLKTILPSNSNHGLCGSVNLGNTCYMNSSIACLSNCTELTTFFLSKEFKKHKNTSNKNGLNGKLADEWYSLLKEYWKTNKDAGNPKNIKSMIAKKDKKFEGDEQQDANEFIIIFLEILGEDLNMVKKKKYEEMLEQQEEESDIQCAQRFWEFHYSRNNSIITDLFCGLNKSIITCPVCKYKSITYIPFNSLNLLIPNKTKLRRIRVENYSKVDISIWYIPLFALAKSYRINIRINKQSSYKDLLNQIKEKISDFPFDITEVDFDVLSVKNKTLDKIIDINTQIDLKTYDDTVQFLIEKEKIKNKNPILIPVYIKLGEKISSYPRGIYAYEGMTFYELKIKLYILIRKYFFLLKKLPEAKALDISKKIKVINQEYDYKELSSLPNLIENEYKILNSLDHNNDDMDIQYPYSIHIQKNITSQETTLVFDGKKDFFENLSPYEINSNESQIDLLTLYLRNLEFDLVVKIDNTFDKFRHSVGEAIDKCIVLESKDYCQRDYLYQDDNSKYITLDDCLHLFNMEEYLESGNEWLCKVCQNKVNAQKKLEFFYLPKILCLCLSRFEKRGSNYRKNEEYIDFPLKNLDMNKYIILKSNLNYIYDIFAVSQHYGGRYGGHYTAICKNYDGNWYSYDDSHCSRASEKDVCSENAYVLFYRRRDW